MQGRHIRAQRFPSRFARELNISESMVNEEIIITRLRIFTQTRIFLIPSTKTQPKQRFILPIKRHDKYYTFNILYFIVSYFRV